MASKILKNEIEFTFFIDTVKSHHSDISKFRPFHYSWSAPVSKGNFLLILYFMLRPPHLYIRPLSGSQRGGLNSEIFLNIVPKLIGEEFQ